MSGLKVAAIVFILTLTPWVTTHLPTSWSVLQFFGDNFGKNFEDLTTIMRAFLFALATATAYAQKDTPCKDQMSCIECINHRTLCDQR